MRFQVLNYGSLNIDHVYQVPHFVAPGETLSAEGYARSAGGKGRVAPAGKWSAVALRALEPPAPRQRARRVITRTKRWKISR